jgi:uncharacterized protein YpuA (DUF1002 family)
MDLIQEPLNLVKYNQDFTKYTFKELIDFCKMVVKLRQQLVDLAEASGCQEEFGNNLNLELAVKKKNTHLDMIYLAKKIQIDYNQTLDIFAKWLAEDDGFEVVEG